MTALWLKVRLILYALYRRITPSRLRLAIRRRLGKPRTWTIAYVILPSDDIHNCVTQLQMRILELHRATTAIPHMSLKLGFEVTALEPYERYFDALVADIEPFEIRVTGIAKFDEERFDEGIIFADVEDNPRLDALRRRVVRDLRQEFGVEPYRLEGDQFRFHITLAYDLSKRGFLKAFEELKAVEINRSFVLNKLCLLCHTGDNWVSYRQAAIAANVSQDVSDQDGGSKGSDPRESGH